MKTACKVQCPQCPFRPTSLPGWLGGYDAGSIFQTAWFNQPFFCHTRTSYEDPNWAAKAAKSGRICLGYLAFANAAMAPKRVDDRPELASTVEDQKLIIRLRAEVEKRTDVIAMKPLAFRDHHAKGPSLSR